MEIVLAKGIPSPWYRPCPPDCGSLVCGHVSHSWRGLLVSGTSQHDWQIYESDGRPWRDPLLLSPHLAVGPVPMECLSAYRALSIAQTVEGLLEQTGIWHPRAQS